MTSVLQYLNFEGARWWFSSWFPHPLVLGKYLCLQNLVGWQPWKRMSFIYLQEIWLQTLFYLNSFSLFQQLFKKTFLLRNSELSRWCMFVLLKSVARLYLPVVGVGLYLYSLLPHKPTHISYFLSSWSQAKCCLFVLREEEVDARS